MEDVHTLAHVMNRTRRRDIGQFTIREPFAVSVPFTAEQDRFYDALISYRKEMLSSRYEPHFIRLITDTLERQAASCLPALVDTLNQFIKTGKFAFTNITDDPDIDDHFDVPPHLLEMAIELKRAGSVLSDRDPKSEELIHIISETLGSEGPGKVLVFSYFLHTLSYLERKLSAKGYRTAIVSGQVKDEEREDLRERFRLNREDHNAIDVLLSSEVGCEGLDYEFCSRLVNYDIPWNPMRIEQRIGRIDRFGQNSEKVQIYNFITPGTIEERIFFRCFDRLGIFKDTVGDMEEILGELTEAITQAALDPSLTPDQAELKAQQLADNALREIEEQRRLEDESTELLGLDRILQEEIEGIEKDGRFVSPDELYLIVSLYLEARCQNARIAGESKQSGLLKLRASKEDRERLFEDLGKLKRQDRQTSEFIRWLEGDDPYLTLTFDQKTAIDNRSVPFITPIHPLTRIAVLYWSKLDNPLFTHLLWKEETGQIGDGIYVFAYYLWETVSLRSDIRLLSLAWNVDKGELSSTLSENLSQLLKQANSGITSILLDQGEQAQILHNLEEAIQAMRSEEVEKLRNLNFRIAEQKLASLNRYYERRMAKVEGELNVATDIKVRKMKESEGDRINREWVRRRREIEEKRRADIISKRVAYGIMKVELDADRL